MSPNSSQVQSGLHPLEPQQPRQLGDARAYTAADLSERLLHWHAPRVNRWERLHVRAGTLVIELLRATGITRKTLTSGQHCWFAPGTRWRVAKLDSDGRFELELHADSKGQAEDPQPLRAELLDGARRLPASDVMALQNCIEALAPGERRIVQGGFDIRAVPEAMLTTRTLFWHPLDIGPATFTALVARSEQAFDLATYLGRDHAVIEATLGDALSGNAERSRWLHATLERHLHMEEELIFPAYIAAGGREAWVRGLKREHRYLRQYLGELDQPISRRKFLRLLDGHDEKEERVVYPDILAQLAGRADELLVRALGCRPASPV